MTGRPAEVAETARGQALSARLFGAALAAAELMTVHLGLELGLYRALATGPCAAPDLAAAAGIGVRYAEEWLEQQTAAGILEVETPHEERDQRRYRLPAGHAAVLAGTDPAQRVAPMAALPVAGIAPALPHLVAAVRRGDGVPVSVYGESLRAAQAQMNEPVFTRDLGPWIRAELPDVHARLRRPGAAIADVGCGTGTSSLALARVYPAATVHGFDLDAAALETARAGVPASARARIRFEATDIAGDDVEAGGPAAPGEGYDLVCVLDALHDMPRPVELLRACRARLRPDGCVLLMEARVAERFAPPVEDNERFAYAVSLLHCLPVGLAEQPSAGTGTVLRPGLVRRYAAAAGFSGVRVLDVRHPFHRLYRLDP